MRHIVPLVPSDCLVMGNIDPAGQFRNGTPKSVRDSTLALLCECGAYPNFVISSGCDIPTMTKWENIDAFFAAVEEFYGD
jgi:uroporphyrinogen decarboxylase